jgi:demethylmenaquinone methyltransferase/2-methoxy-6-polyprenyl-1,4-benzoquinol methylase
LLGQGTAPAGTENEQQAATWVRGMFGRIAPRYDLLNHLLSMNIDRYWRARTVSRVAPVLAKPGAQVLDVCCGTGDLMLALETASKPARGPAADQGIRPTVFGSDFCHPMLVAARHKVEQRRSRCALFEADALQLPVANASLDLLTIAFGFRNLANYQHGLQELLRVLKPGGAAAILEFSTPPNLLLSRLYGFYSRAILPTIGGWISGSKEAYTYLPESVRRFPGAVDLAEQMRAAGFANVRFERMTAGIVALHIGERT